MTNNNSNNQKYFEVKTVIFAGSNERRAFDEDALQALGFNGVDFKAVKAMLNTAVLPREAFYPFFAIRKSVHEFLSQMGQQHDLLGRLFNPNQRVEVVNFLREQQERYEDAKQDFLNNYARLVREQLEKIEQSAVDKGLDPTPLVEAVKSNQPPIDYYSEKLQFRFIDSTIELDGDQWQSEIDQINTDLVKRSSYELARDAAKIRDLENPRTKAKKLIELQDHLMSISFYVKSLSGLADEIGEAVSIHGGGIRPAKEYTPREILSLTGIARVLELNSESLVDATRSFNDFFSLEQSRVDQLLAEDDEEDVQDSFDSNDLSQDSDNLSTDLPLPITPPSSNISSGAFAF